MNFVFSCVIKLIFNFESDITRYALVYLKIDLNKYIEGALFCGKTCFPRAMLQAFLKKGVFSEQWRSNN